MKKITLDEILIFLISASFFALFFAYISQYFFGLQPCHLCVWQRFPFFVIAIFSSLILAFLKNNFIKKITIFLSMFLLAINSTIALYHVGVEKKIFKIQESCISQNQAEYASIDELRNALLKEKATRCDEPPFFFLTLSMAAWNFIYCLFLFIITFFLYLKSQNNEARI